MSNPAFAQKVAVVTGANRGLGLETCRRLAGLGMKVVLTARDPEKAAQAAATLASQGLSVQPETLDVSRDDSVAAFAGRLSVQGVAVDVLVNNAGATFDPQGAATFDVPAALVARAFDTNALGAYRMIQAFLPAMLARGFGRIVSVSSGMAALAEMNGRSPAYRISKTALSAITRVFHAEVQGDVKINVVCPGWVRTDMGGPSATRSVEDGARGIVWAATLPTDGPSGGFFRDGQPIPW